MQQRHKTKSGTPRPLASIYSRYFTLAEKRALRAIPAGDCTGEIRLLRVLAARSLAEHSSDSTPLDISSRVKIMRSNILFAEQIARLSRAQALNHDPLDELQKTILEVVMSLNPIKEL